jgi:hypothetical protein
MKLINILFENESRKNSLERKKRLIDFVEENIKEKNFKNFRSKGFLFHGTDVNPNNFQLRDDYENEDGNDWSGELPEGYLFLTTNLDEALGYGQYIILCELKRYNKLTIDVNKHDYSFGDNPSRFFDMDYGIDLYMPDKYINIWDKFENSRRDVLEIKGNNKSTIITNINNIIPRTDLSIKFY